MNKQYLTWYEAAKTHANNYLRLWNNKSDAILDLNNRHLRVKFDLNNKPLQDGNYYLAYDNIGFYIYKRS